jgi:hypothetical protein
MASILSTANKNKQNNSSRHLQKLKEDVEKDKKTTCEENVHNNDKIESLKRNQM